MAERYAVKRRYPRIRSRHAVLVKRLGPEPLEGFSRTGVVGLGGCMFLADEPLGEGSVLELLIAVRGDVVRATARVVYELPRAPGRREVGVEFLDLPDRDREVLINLFPPEELQRYGITPP